MANGYFFTNKSNKHQEPKTSKAASVLNWIETNKVNKERYLMRKDKTIYTFSINISFSSIGQDKSKLEKQISKLIIIKQDVVYKNTTFYVEF